jgi:hypothetical protein
LCNVRAKCEDVLYLLGGDVFALGELEDVLAAIDDAN